MNSKRFDLESGNSTYPTTTVTKLNRPEKMENLPVK
jgi:hypothetical protein